MTDFAFFAREQLLQVRGPSSAFIGRSAFRVCRHSKLAIRALRLQESVSHHHRLGRLPARACGNLCSISIWMIQPVSVRDGEAMRSHLYRASVVVMIIGLALIGRGVGMGNATLLWTGVSLAGANIILLLFWYCRRASKDAHGETTSPDTCVDS